MNYSELLQLAKGWGDFISDRIIIWRLPKNYLTGIGYTSDRDRNQIANFTYLDYNTNIDISDDPPAEYVDRYRQKLGEDGYKKTCSENALPVDFEKMSYPDFLEQRRKLMAGIVKKAYQKLCE